MTLDLSLAAAWAAVFIGVLAVVAGLGGVWWQLRKASLLHSAQMVTALADRFSSEPILQARMDFAAQLEGHRNGKSVDFSGDMPVLGFFENVGHLVRRRALDEQMAWNKFGWHLVRYYVALTFRGNVLDDLRRRETEPDLYCEFEWICRRTLRTYRRLGVGVEDSQLKAAWLDQLFAQERRLIEPRIASHGHTHSVNGESTANTAPSAEQPANALRDDPPNKAVKPSGGSAGL